MSDTSRIQYIIRDGVLKLSGQIRYQDRDLRLALMKLMQVPQHQVCLDLELDGLVEIEEVTARPSRAPGTRKSRPPAASH